MEVRAVEVTGSHIEDAPALPDILGRTPRDEKIGCVTADGACDTRNCHDAIANRYVNEVNPQSRNAKPSELTTAGVAVRKKASRASKYLGGAIWRNWGGYHGGSHAEIKMHCIKLLGQRLWARDFDQQDAEVQVRIAIMNNYIALGIPMIESVG